MRASGFPGFKKPKTGTTSSSIARISIKNDGLDLIDDHDNDDDMYDTEKAMEVEAITAPLISHDAAAEAQEGSLPQYGVFGQVLRTNAKGFPYKPDDKRLYCNINAPFTAVVCGVQGSGKSHTVSVLLESMLIQDPRLGVLPSALSGLVLHFGESGSTLKPCEATFVGNCESPLVLPPEVVVFCSPSNYRQVARSYAQFGGSAKVYPLYFVEEDVDATSLLSLMAVSESGQMPLYMHMVMQVLSDLGQDYSYTNFKMRLGTLQLEPLQARMLDQRLTLLEGFLCRKDGSKLVAVKRPHPEIRQPREGRFKQGQLTIVDLTDPFISPSSACSLFEIVLKLFNKAELKCSKVVVLDEAHKYLSAEGSMASEGSKRLTDRLLTFTRQQRHLAMRVIISTQEPTVIPSSLLDLCSFIVCHRFFSAGWFGHLAKHISTELDAEAFERVVMLDRGECLIFSPTSLFVTAPEETQDSHEGAWGKAQGEGAWGVSTSGDWVAKGDNSPNNNSGLGSAPVASAEPTSNEDDGGWGSFFAKKLPNGSASAAAPPAASSKVSDEEHGIEGKDNNGDVASSTSSGDDGIDIIIRDSDSVAEGVSKLAMAPADDQGDKVSSSGWNAAPASVKKHEKEVGQLGRGYIVAKTRRRITDDGGRSILATDQ